MSTLKLGVQIVTLRTEMIERSIKDMRGAINALKVTIYEKNDEIAYWERKNPLLSNYHDKQAVKMMETECAVYEEMIQALGGLL